MSNATFMSIPNHFLRRINATATTQFIKILPDIIVIACCLISFGLSIIQSRINSDAHHWGLMYANAVDLLNGLIPYKQIFIQYGFLTTVIQSFSLIVLGNQVVSVGVITGAFYALNIYLSYFLWQKITSKWLAALSSVLMFLMHGYVTYPWANYLSYTFLLIALLLLTSSLKISHKYLLAGLLLGFSFLARQSLLPIIIPICLYFGLLYFSSEPPLRKVHVRNFLILNGGLFGVIGVFFLYIIQQSLLTDWIAQSIVVTRLYVSKYFLINFVVDILTGGPSPRKDIRTVIYSFVFFNALFLGRMIFLKAKKYPINEREKSLFLFSSITLFGYLNSLHSYEVMRLQSSSSLGLGLLLLSFEQLSKKFRQHKLFFCIPIVCLFFYLSQTLLFTQSSTVYFPWNRDLLFGNQLQEPQNIPMLKGKLYNSEERDYYQNLAQTMNDHSCQLEYLVNFSMNSYIPHLSTHFKNVQRSPFFSQRMADLIFQDEQAKIKELLNRNQALLVAASTTQIPDNYKVILQIAVPMNIPWIGDVTYVAVPSIFADSCPSEPKIIKNSQ